MSNLPLFELKTRLKSDHGLLLTPLIDLIFLVLIFFIINARPPTYGIKTTPPQALHAEAGRRSGVTVSINADGEISVDNSKVILEDIGVILEALVEENSGSLYIRADGAISYDRFIAVLDEVRTVTNEIILETEAVKDIE